MERRAAGLHSQEIIVRDGPSGSDQNCSPAPISDLGDFGWIAKGQRRVSDGTCRIALNDSRPGSGASHRNHEYVQGERPVERDLRET